jgi:hypothetical protein
MDIYVIGCEGFSKGRNELFFFTVLPLTSTSIVSSSHMSDLWDRLRQIGDCPGELWEKILVIDPELEQLQEINPRCARLVRDIEADSLERRELERTREQRREENTRLADMECKEKYKEAIEDNAKYFKHKEELERMRRACLELAAPQPGGERP